MEQANLATTVRIRNKKKQIAIEKQIIFENMYYCYELNNTTRPIVVESEICRGCGMLRVEAGQLCPICGMPSRKSIKYN